MNKNNIMVACLLLGGCGIAALGTVVSDLIKEMKKMKRRVTKLECEDMINKLTMTCLIDDVNKLEEQFNTEEAE